MKITLDSNIFIAIQNSEEEAPDCELILNAIEQGVFKAAVSTIVIAEVLTGMFEADSESERNAMKEKFNFFFEIIPVTALIAESAAETRFKRKIKLPDALIFETIVASKSDYLISKDHPLMKKEEKVIIHPREFVENFIQN